MKRLFRLAYLNVLILACLIVLGMLSVVFYFQSKQLFMLNQWVAHTQETMINGYNILNDEQRIHLAVQRFIISGNETYLEDYQQLTQVLYHDLFILDDLTRDNPSQQQRLDDLQKLMQAEFSLITPVVALRKNHSLAGTLKEMQGQPLILANKISENINKTVQDVLLEEKGLLKTRSANFLNHIIIVNKIGLVANIISLFVIAICMLLLNRQLIRHFFTEKKLEKSEVKFRNLAYLDPVTGLDNRTSLIEKLSGLIQKSKLNSSKLTLFYIDLDNFKSINDSFGHTIGDQVLRATATRIKDVFNESYYIFRISGDEFVVVLDDGSNRNKISQLAQQLLTAFALPIHINSHQIISTISIGICTFPEFAQDTDSLLRNADIAMYRAKQYGKNNFQFCNHEMIKEFENKSRLFLQLQLAVRNKEFILMYQPKLSLKTNQPSGLEALIRWKRSDVDLVYPSEFITIAENNGLIIPIGEWVMRSVCEQVGQWRQAGINVSNVAFNVSIREFLMRDFVMAITKIFRDFDFDPKNLEIEITETILMEDSYNNFASLEYLKSLGMKITIDDFGTGYSSLSYLNLFSVDKLKIDKSFIAQINPQNPEPVIIGAIISMAHKLGIDVVAEGVETKMQLDFLKHHGCDEIQGYHFSRPLSSEEIGDFLRQPHLQK